MIDRHAVQALLRAGRPTREIAEQFGISQRTVQRIAHEPPVEEGEDRVARRARGVGRPAVPNAVGMRLVELIKDDPEAPPLEYLRLLREEAKVL